jgi:hypothetical protein
VEVVERSTRETAEVPIAELTAEVRRWASEPAEP